jgi:hypothetical protein
MGMPFLSFIVDQVHQACRPAGNPRVGLPVIAGKTAMGVGGSGLGNSKRDCIPSMPPPCRHAPAPPSPSVIIAGFTAQKFIMEAERLNALSASLTDLTTREAELRRYL